MGWRFCCDATGNSTLGKSEVTLIYIYVYIENLRANYFAILYAIKIKATLVPKSLI